MEMAIQNARSSAARAERLGVAAEVRSLAARSGLPNHEFARRIGTSPSRLSTYLFGRVTPSAALMVRMRVAAAAAGTVEA